MDPWLLAKTLHILSAMVLFGTGIGTAFQMVWAMRGDRAEVVSITKPGAEIHNYEPTPSDLIAARGADLILRNGLNLELWFEQFLRNLGDIPSVTVSDGFTAAEVTKMLPSTMKRFFTS